MRIPLVNPLVILLFLIIWLFSCGGSGPRQHSLSDKAAQTSQSVSVPEFNADSAFQFVARQVEFGPRVPNTEAHQQCGIWLTETMQRFADTVYVQQARVRAYNGTILNIRNIIGVFQPERRNRILLCAHWDSRPYADWDPDPANHYRPIDGANDGASGVGVLLEIARLLHKEPAQWGVDILLLDAEDYGKHHAASGMDEDSWALGAQYWSNNPHRIDYNANFGILLDMVGASHATFKKEGYSMMYAPNIVRNVWNKAQQLGFGNYFINQEGGFITDDHYYINKIRNIPTINIIHLDSSTRHGFFPQWHTIDDTIDYIDPQTLSVVGRTVSAVIYQQP